MDEWVEEEGVEKTTQPVHPAGVWSSWHGGTGWSEEEEEQWSGIFFSVSQG